MNRSLKLKSAALIAAAVAMAGVAVSSAIAATAAKPKPLAATDIAATKVIDVVHVGHVHAGTGPCACTNCVKPVTAKWNGETLDLSGDTFVFTVMRSDGDKMPAKKLEAKADAGDVLAPTAKTVLIAAAKIAGPAPLVAANKVKNGAFTDGQYLAGSTSYRIGATERPIAT